MTPHRFLVRRGEEGVRRRCAACGVPAEVSPGLLGTPFDTTPPPHHANPKHSTWQRRCPLCQACAAWVRREG